MLRRDLLELVLSVLAGSPVVDLLDDPISDQLDDPLANPLDERERSDAPANARDGESRTAAGDQSRTAVVDRIEGDDAVLLFEDGSGETIVSTATLPEPAREEGVVLSVPEGDSLATVDRAATARRRRDARERFDELAEPASAPDQETKNATRNATVNATAP